MTRARLASFGLTLFLAPLFLAPGLAAAADPDKATRRLENAREVLVRLLEGADGQVPARLMEKARCVAVFPSVVKGAFVVGGHHGRGVASCLEGNAWSAPAFFKMSGGSFGFQIGGEATDLVLVFLTDGSMRSLLKSKFTLGGDVTLAAGPIGRSGEAATDLGMRAEILAYARSRGVFAGISFEGAKVSADHKATSAYYGKRLWPEEILVERQVRRLPPEARRFVDALP